MTRFDTSRTGFNRVLDTKVFGNLVIKPDIDKGETNVPSNVPSNVPVLVLCDFLLLGLP